jgi:lambda family phage tail tape measure protein
VAKQVEDIVVRLVGEGFEALDKIKGSFRELGKVTNLAEKDILSARDSLSEFAKKAGNTEAVNKGLIEAFKGLRSQTQLCGDAYGELTAEITRLEAVQRGSTAAADRQREALLRNAAAGKQNAAAIEQQIQGLTRLQQQTRPGSSAFLQLGKDIEAARVNLGKFKSEAAAFSSTLNQIPGASLDTLGRQIGRLTQGMQTLKIASDEYLNTQQRISLLGEVRGRTTGRQQVRAANQMFESPQFQSFAASRAANLELPSTLAGIQQRVGEINAELQNVSGYTRRRSLTIELADLNRRLKSSIVDVVTQENLAVDAVRRRVNASREINQASGFGAFSSQVAGGEFDPAITTSIRRARERLERENDRLRAAAAEAIQISRTPLLPAAGQTSAAGTGQLISGGARRLRGQVETTFGAGLDEASNTPRAPWQQNYLPNAAVGTAPAVGFAAGAAQAFDNLGRSTDRARRPLRDIFAELERVRGASNGSVNSLQAQISAWAQIRSAVSSSAPVFATATRQIEALSRQQARLEIGGGRRLTGSQLAQGAGAALSGGIFGGPEGLIGGLGGLAVGGVGGAFAGAAAGAQVGMFRQQLGGTADYAASIGKLQIALRGVVGSQAAYDAAIRAAAAATRDLNIPQEEATRGLTRLSAAVIGAGGTVADSSFAFRAMSEAIKATGGNAEQVDGALLALTQVFSKGKVSAEELNQIAERLPGTFTLFAQAAGKTGPELQKALEQGQVGLNDLMKFLDLTSKRYGTTALEIAGSSQDAGARLTVAFQAMRLEVGKALQPLGAELQEAFADFIKDITPEVISSVKAIAEVIKFFTTNETAGGLARFALQMGAVALAIKGLQAASAGLVALNIAGWFTGAATGIRITGDAAAVAAPKVGLLKTALGGFVGLVSKPIVVTIVIASVIDAIKRISNLNTAFADFLKLSKQPIRPDAWLKSVGGDALSPERLKEFAGEASKALKFNTSELERLKKERATVVLQQLGAEDNIQQAILNTRLITINTEISNAEKRAKESQAKLNAIYGQLNTPKPAAAVVGTIFPSPAGEDKDKGAEKAARDAAAAAADQQRLNESLAKARIALDDEVFRNAMELVRKKYEYEQELEGKRRNLLVLSQTGAARGTAELVASYFENMQTLTNRLANAGDVVKTATQGLKSATSLAETTVSTFAAAGGGAIANILPGTRGGPNINEGVGYGRGRLHAGQDLGLDIGDPIHARRAGTVMQAYPSGFGRVGGAVVVRYDDGTQGTYGHTTPSVRAGSAVAAGQRIATVAPDGSNTHLHYELRDALGKLINPINALTASLKVPAGARQATGVAAATRRDVAAEGGAATAAQGLAQAKALQALEEKQVKDLTALGNEEFVLKYTDALRQQNAALADAATVTELRNRLQLAGERPETIEAEVRKTEETMRARQETEFLTKAIETLTGKGPAAEESANAFRAALAAQNVELANTKTKLDEAAAAQIAFNEAMRTRQDDRIGLGMQEGVTSYIESIGTMRQATEELTVNGIKGVENAIFDLVTTGKTNFREFAADILKQTARMIIQQLVLRNVMLIVKSAFGFADGGVFGGGGASLGFGGASDPLGAGGAFWNAKGNAFTGKGVAAYAMGGTFAKNNIIPYAKGGTFTNSVVSKPTLFKFAAGGTMQTGVMGEAGPEAIMPLSRGPNGKLGVASNGGGGTTNVTVNVDASGSKTQGDSTKSEQLGRAVSQAVQDELLRQKRPGGLLA